jgi:hypothetical protein
LVEAAGVEPAYPYTIFNIINWLIFSGGTAGIPVAHFHGKFVPKLLKYLVKVGVIDGAIFSTDLLLVIIPSCHHFSTSRSDTPNPPPADAPGFLRALRHLRHPSADPSAPRGSSKKEKAVKRKAQLPSGMLKT